MQSYEEFSKSFYSGTPEFIRNIPRPRQEDHGVFELSKAQEFEGIYALNKSALDLGLDPDMAAGRVALFCESVAYEFEKSISLGAPTDGLMYLIANSPDEIIMVDAMVDALCKGGKMAAFGDILERKVRKPVMGYLGEVAEREVKSGARKGEKTIGAKIAGKALKIPKAIEATAKAGSKHLDEEAARELKQAVTPKPKKVHNLSTGEEAVSSAGKEVSPRVAKRATKGYNDKIAQRMKKHGESREEAVQAVKKARQADIDKRISRERIKQGSQEQMRYQRDAARTAKRAGLGGLGGAATIGAAGGLGGAGLTKILVGGGGIANAANFLRNWLRDKGEDASKKAEGAMAGLQALAAMAQRAGRSI